MITPTGTPYPIITPFPIFSLGGGESNFGKMVGKVKEAFDVQVKRGGKFMTISKTALPRGEAMKLGAERVTKTLAATFRLKAKGTTTTSDIPYTLSGATFRAPKSGEKLTFIEKKQYRLKKGTGELPEILTIRAKGYGLGNRKSKKSKKSPMFKPSRRKGIWQ